MLKAVRRPLTRVNAEKKNLRAMILKYACCTQDLKRPACLGQRREESECVEFGTIMKNGLSFKSHGGFQGYYKRPLSCLCPNRILWAAVLASTGTVRCCWREPGKKGGWRKAGGVLTELLGVLWGKAWLDSWRVCKRGWRKHARITPRLFVWELEGSHEQKLGNWWRVCLGQAWGTSDEVSV